MNLIRYDRWGTDFVRNLQKLILRWYLQTEAYEISIHSFFAEADANTSIIASYIIDFLYVFHNHIPLFYSFYPFPPRLSLKAARKQLQISPAFHVHLTFALLYSPLCADISPSPHLPVFLSQQILKYYIGAASYLAIADQAGKDSRCKQPYNAIFPDTFSETHCSNIFSINIPYPLLASCTNTWVTAPASFPFWIIGDPLTSESSNGQHFLLS